MAKASSPSRKPPAGGTPTTECPICGQWEISADDGYCGFCGHLLLPLTVRPEALILISTLAPRQSLTLRNAGAQPLQVAIVPRPGESFPAVSFTPTACDIPPAQEARIRVDLDAAQLPVNFQTRELDFACRVHDDPRRQLPLRITVRSGPRPMVRPASLSFGEVQEGKTVERSVAIVNAGGTPLKVLDVRPEGASQLRLKTSFVPTLVAPAQRLSLAVLWDGNAEENGDDPAKAGLRFRFGNVQEELFVSAQAKTFRYLLELKPPAIQLDQVAAKRDHPLRVELANQGTVDLEIEGIETDQPWLEVVGSAARFTLLCAETAGARTGEVSPQTFARRRELKMVIHPQELGTGRHRSRVTLRPVGQEPKALAVEVNVIQSRFYPDYVGIDFGTSNSVVAVFDRDSHEIELVSDADSPLIPSVLVFEDAATYIIGQAAKNAMATAAERTVRSIKRIMGYDQEREICGRSFTPEELAACIIRQLVQLIESKLHADSGLTYDVRKAIITVPANFFDLQIRGVLAACRAAGLDTEENKVLRAAQAMRAAVGQAVNAGIILDEPSAAVLYYIYHLSRHRSASDLMAAIDREQGLRLLVFDHGGGTLDVSVATVVRLPSREAGLRILANMGDNEIGGDSIDLILMNDLVERCRERAEGVAFDTALLTPGFRELDLRRQREAWSLDVWRTVLRVRGEWKDLAEAVKVQLSEREQTEVEIPPDLIVSLAEGQVRTASRSVKLAVSRSHLQDLLQATRERCAQLVESCLDLAGVAREQIDYILHTGRQSLLPLIRERVRELFPHLTPERDVLEPEHLKVCVAKGAALYGWMRNKLVDPEARIHFLTEGRRLPHSYGVEKFTGLMQPELDEVIPRGAPHPAVAEKLYGPEMIPSSGCLNLRFYQNTGNRKQILDNPQVSLIGQISIDSMVDGKPGCLVRFVIDANRKLEVFADGQEVPIQPGRLRGEESWMG
jgi:molecular chaperone DnaK (HSP70)